VKEIKDSSQTVMDILEPGDNKFVIASGKITSTMATAGNNARVLGEEYPNTSLSAFEPVCYPAQYGDVAAIDILKKRLLEGSDRLEANSRRSGR